MRAAALTSAEHVVRADEHERLAHVLAGEGLEWAAVTYFYSAYHLVKAALLDDPVFEQPARLRALDVRLTIAERHVTRHSGYMQFGRGGSRTKVWGLNDLVGKLYRQIWPFYVQLHEASVDVRYYNGLRVPLIKLAEAQRLIKDEYAAGTLAAAVPPAT